MGSGEEDEDSAEAEHEEKQIRNGFQEFKAKQLNQYKSYLEGLEEHSQGNHGGALHKYKMSLMIGMEVSFNWCRLAALENMQLFKFAEPDKNSDKKRRPDSLITTQLRKHICHKRSIVFLLDTQFSDVFYQKQANEFMQKVFKQLTDQDSFGYICIGNEMIMPCPEMVLEPKKFNLNAKKQFMHDINTDNHLSKMRKSQNKGQARLNQSLLKAIEWQHNIATEKVQHLGHEYDNPHKWIICLLGDDNFTLNSNSVKNAANQKVNISILGLRSEEFGIRSKDYWQVCDDTEEGVFVNIKKKDSCRSILD